MSKPRTVSVTIMDKEYQVACPPDQEAELIVSASYLDKQMRSIRESGKVIGLERIAVMAALNISHELLQASEQEETAPEVSEEAVSRLTERIDEAIFSLRQIEISLARPFSIRYNSAGIPGVFAREHVLYPIFTPRGLLAADDVQVRTREA